MKKIAFFDIEVKPSNKEIEKLGLLINEDRLSTSSLDEIKKRFLEHKPFFICGHNFIDHDYKFLSDTSFNPLFKDIQIIDTLYLSMLLFVNKRTHKLEKPYKTEVNIENQPLGDAEQTKELFKILDYKFNNLDNNIKNIFANLLFDNKYFSAYFNYKKFNLLKINVYKKLKSKIVCKKEKLDEIINHNPLELAFVIAYLFSDNKASISSVILIRHPKVVEVLKILTFNKNNLDLEKIALQEFKIPTFRDFDAESSEKDGLFAEKISQKDIVQNSLERESLLAILPTGGGKTFCFQLPALIKAKAYKGLTVVISPLQALMKNHVDGFKEKNQNFKVVAISGYLSPIERMNTISEIENGVVDILYLAPEALRSESIFKALKRRIIERFVIDEAHCFSSWGHDFRHDYYFIANTIKELEKSSEFQFKIPVSCFTATAKPEVLKDIKNYFIDNLEIQLLEFIASSKRYNLEYSAIEVSSKKEKYETLIKQINLLGKVPTIIYIPQNAKECKELSEKLNEDERISYLNLEIEPFYSKIDEQIEKGHRKGRNKSEILQDFIDNKIDIVIATTAFGMGIDKADIKAVIHYEQSDSLESYLQESGRGARSENLKAQCIVLYSKEDFNRTFSQLNRTKVDYNEIERIVKALKNIKRKKLYLSPKQIAEKMGLDIEDSAIDYETIIKTALLELEQAGVIQRGRNSYKIFATSIDKKKRSMEYVHSVLDARKEEFEGLYEYMIMLMQNIVNRSKIDAIEVDSLADNVGIERNKIFSVLNELQKLKLLEYDNDITVFVKNSIKYDFEKNFELEEKILSKFEELNDYESSISLKEINTYIDNNKNNLVKIKKIIQSWTHLSKLKQNIFNAYFNNNICNFEIEAQKFTLLKSLIKVRKEACTFIINNLLRELKEKEENEIEISSNKLKNQFDKEVRKLSLEGFHHSLVYLNDLIKDSYELRKGRLIYYQSFKIDKKEAIEENLPYGKRKHYNKSLKPYYERKIESIHIQIAFLEKLIKEGWAKTSEFVKDYFSMQYDKFKRKYNFNNNEIRLPITQEKYKEILYDLNEEQKEIFESKKESIMVLAGPGSGKTKTLVHKIASLVTIENYKAEYFLMLAHSRVAVSEFKNRLYKLIGNQAYEMKIFTFHSFAIELLGKKIEDNDELKNIIKKATLSLKEKEINLPLIQMLVLDEYQDVGEDTYSFIKAIYENMSSDKKIIAVGDDDQCINDFGNDKAEIKFINSFKKDFESFDKEGVSNFTQYELLTNYRSKEDIVSFANSFNKKIPNRLKINDLVCSTSSKGIVSLYKYKCENFLVRLVENIKIDDSNNIAILARTNDEVLNIYSFLSINNIKSKYILEREGFSLGNIIELQSFLKFWEKSSFEEARSQLEIDYKKSKNYKLANSVIDRFYQEHEDNHDNLSSKYIISLFKEYLNEISFEEFEYTKSRIIVSTMHKSKGKEFDSVYVYLSKEPKNIYDIRLTYVAITRAKIKLEIHTLSEIFDDMKDSFYKYELVDSKFNNPDKLVFIMGLSDISLGNNYSRNGVISSNPISGEEVKIIKKDYTFDIYKDNYQIARLAKPERSERLSSKVFQKIKEGYILEEIVHIENIVCWRNESDDEFPQVLCKIYMRKTS